MTVASYRAEVAARPCVSGASPCAMDTFSPEKRSKIMRAIRSRDTLPEILVRKWLFAQGYRFRVCDKRVVGHPDVVLPRLRR